MNQLNPQICRIRGALAHLATRNDQARRRHPSDPEDELLELSLPPFLVDIHRITFSKASRRLRAKTQVRTAQTNAHVRDRGSHSSTVANFAELASFILGLNDRLAVAMALGHDLGHTPFGHTGEDFLTKFYRQKDPQADAFNHGIFGTVVCQEIERRGRGLNLCWQTLYGIGCHSSGKNAIRWPAADAPPEAKVVLFSDKMGFLLDDYADMFGPQRGLLSPEDFPELKQAVEELGATQRERASRLIGEFCLECAAAGEIRFEKSAGAELFAVIRKEMYRVYSAYNSYGADAMLERTYEFLEHVLKPAFPSVQPEILLALMTDRDIIDLQMKPCQDLSDLHRTSAWELIPYLREHRVDYSKLDLDW